MAASTRCRVLARTWGWLLSTLEAVLTDTPASAATSLSRVAIVPPSAICSGSGPCPGQTSPARWKPARAGRSRSRKAASRARGGEHLPRAGAHLEGLDLVGTQRSCACHLGVSGWRGTPRRGRCGVPLPFDDPESQLALGRHVLARDVKLGAPAPRHEGDVDLH